MRRVRRRDHNLVGAFTVLMALGVLSCGGAGAGTGGGAANSPNSPITGIEKAGTYSSFVSAARDVIAEGNYAYVATYTSGSAVGGVAVVDVSNKASPSLIGSYFPSLSAYRLYASYIVKSGSYVYIDGGSVRAFAKVDVSTPSSPSLVYQLSGSYSPILAVDGPTLYLSCFSTYELRAYDVSDTLSPLLLTTYTNSGDRLYYVLAESGYVYLSDSTAHTTQVLQMSSNRQSLTKVAEYDGFGSMNKAGNYLYILNFFTGMPSAQLQVVDVSNPAAPVKKGSVDTGRASSDDLRVAQGCAFVAANGLIDLYDVADPANPHLITSFSDSSLQSMNGISICDDYVYVADGGGGSGKLRIYHMLK